MDADASGLRFARCTYGLVAGFQAVNSRAQGLQGEFRVSGILEGQVETRGIVNPKP